MNNNLTRYAWISIVAAMATMVLKAAAYYITGSVGLLSDAIESVVNLAGGIMALAMLTIAARPADEEHQFGHSKAEYFSSGVEGSLILLAAISIAWTAVPRLFHPKPLEGIGAGLLVSTLASVINLVVALWILRAGRKHGSITLEANAKHLMTDVWTSVGVIGAVGLVALTGWQWLDPVVALLVAANIIWAGVGIMSRSAAGLMDKSLPADERDKVDDVLARYRNSGVEFHAVMTRQAGMRRFVTMHVLVPGEWTVMRGHALVDDIEADICSVLENCHVTTHLEPVDDPRSFEDEKLEREPRR
ncbi:MAG: cation diffusion facilitator family transporter [Opitutaceae bacterium]|jgi:cation diffusion facilitator family transporter